MQLNKNKNRVSGIIFFSLISFFILMHLGCKKLIEVDAPYTSVNAQNVYNNNSTAASVLTGIYTKISDFNSSYFISSEGSPGNISLISSLSADELTLYNKDLTNLYYYYINSLSSTLPSAGAGFWTNLYPYIFITNAAVEGISNSSSLSTTVQNQLLGEAKFMRAFCYFYLVNFYGDVPLVLSTDPLKNASISRTPKDQVYGQIIKDLNDAFNLMSEFYVAGDATSATAERVRPIKWAAAALLARVYLYTNDFANAEAQATAVINQKSLYQLPSLSMAFLKNNSEAIWQLQPVTVKNNANTGEGKHFILPSTGPDNDTYPIYLSNALLNSFESGDQRRNNWVDSVKTDKGVYYFPYKYKVSANNPNGIVSEYLVMLRLGEQYLIRAEARTRLGNISGAQEDLNTIRNRAGLKSKIVSSQDSLLAEILHERQVELFTEGAHRWFDLKRTNNIDIVMSEVASTKGGVWNTNWQYYPIPLNELTTDPNLTQNQGYTN